MQEISQGIKEEKSDLKLTKIITLDGGLHFDPLYQEIGKSHNTIWPFFIKRIV